MTLKTDYFTNCIKYKLNILYNGVKTVKDNWVTYSLTVLGQFHLRDDSTCLNVTEIF